MFTLKYRPATFNEVAGQSIPKSILEQVAIYPDGKPQVYLLAGPWGAGKTSLAMLFAKALNCLSKVKPCLTCINCVEKFELYCRIYDSAVVGNVAAVRELKESWSFLSGPEKYTIIMDEVQSASKDAMAALLDFTENPPKNVFVLFCSTDPEKLIKPLVSRSFLLEFEEVVSDEIEVVLKRISLKEGLKLSGDLLKGVAKYAGGHVRDAVMLLEKAVILGEDVFLKQLVSTQNLFDQLVKARLSGQVVLEKSIMEALSKIPLKVLNRDFEFFMRDFLDSSLSSGVPVVSPIGVKLFSIYVRLSKILGKSTSDFMSFLTVWLSLVSQDESKKRVEQKESIFVKK